ncbi:MAG TPA: ATP-binding protein [Ktedonobacteraceae bacterium]|nr:ATP-binding protein [Ktedonobacteraceae bacterium]
MNKVSQRKQKKSLVRLIRRRLLVVVSLLAFAFLFNFLVGSYVSNRQYNLGEQKVALQQDQDALLIAMLNQETGLRGYIATNNPVFLEPFNSGRPQYLLSLQQLLKQAHGIQATDFSATNTVLAQVAVLANAWYSTYAEVQIKNMQSGNLAAARSPSTDAVGKELFDTFRASLVRLQQAVDNDVNNIQQRVAAINQFALLIALLLSAIALSILGYTYIMFVKGLRDLNILKAATNQQGSGDLSARVQELTYDELNQVGQTFNMVAAELQQRQIVLQLQRDELTAVNSALEDANRVRGEFLSTMSHELRTPLASIIGFSQMLLDDAEKADWNQKQQNDLKRILKNGQHLLSLINDVLDLSKIEAGRMVLKYSQIDVQELLTSVVEEIQSMAFAQRLVLRAEVEDGIDFLESNPMKLRQILLNLVSNAIKFTEQGEVTISATRVISSEQQADQIAIAVKDSGMGISSDIQEHIFEAFYQADGSYARKSGGTGLGLTIVSQLTKLLGGTIAIKSAPGQGSTFTVRLPIKAVHHSIGQDLPRLHAAQQSEASTIFSSSNELTPAMPAAVGAVTAQRAAADGQPNMVLAIDDNPDAIVLIEAALKDTPFTVVGVQDPLKVMELVQEMRPCAIILDVMMPDLNGWQILYQLKASPATSSIPVVMLTVIAEPTTGYVLGADEYLIKPFQSDVLLNTLRHIITSQKTSSQADERETEPV